MPSKIRPFRLVGTYVIYFFFNNIIIHRNFHHNIKSKAKVVKLQFKKIIDLRATRSLSSCFFHVGIVCIIIIYWCKISFFRLLVVCGTVPVFLQIYRYTCLEHTNNRLIKIFFTALISIFHCIRHKTYNTTKEVLAMCIIFGIIRVLL